MPRFARAWRGRASLRVAMEICVVWVFAASGWAVQAATENENLSSQPFQPSADEDAQRLADEATIAYATGDYARAAELYTQLLGAKPADARIFVNRGNSYSKLRDADRAISDYTTALKIAPSLVRALVNRGALFVQRKQFAEALADFEKAAALRPADGLIAYHRGVALARSGQRKQAAEAFDHAVALAPGFAPPQAERGFLYLADNETEAAREQFEAALRLEPANARARSGMRLVAGESADMPRDGDDPLDTALADELIGNAHQACFSNADDSNALVATVSKMKWVTSSASSTRHARTWRLASPFGRGQLVYVMPSISEKKAVCALTVDGVTLKLSNEIQAALGRRYGEPPTSPRTAGADISQYSVPHGDDCEVTVSLHGSADDGRFTVRMSHEQKRPTDM